VDDASTDGSPAVAREYAQAGHPVRTIRLRRNQGPATARNAALRAVDEPVVAFLDADDYWLPDHLATQVKLLEQTPEAVLAFGRGRMQGGGAGEATPTFDAGVPVNPLPQLLVDNVVPQSAAVVRREAVLACGGYTPGMRHAEDYDLWLRLALLGPFIYSGRLTCVRQSHDGQASHQSVRMARGIWEARHRFWNAACQCDAGPPPQLYEAGCTRAYELQLSMAWRSRDRTLLREVIRLAPAVPGGPAAVRRWKRRERVVYPIWRLAATIWDAIPPLIRAPLQRRRRRGATKREYEHRAALGWGLAAEENGVSAMSKRPTDAWSRTGAGVARAGERNGR
jgi:glycosyltransferase involved in cell wall biosynthesis